MGCWTNSSVRCCNERRRRTAGRDQPNPGQPDGVLHECDVLVLPRAEADLSRNARIAPRGNQCLLAVECKYYVADLGLELARNFEGLHADLRAKHQLFVANTDSASVVKYLSARK